MYSLNDWIDEARKKREIEGDAKYGPINPLNDTRSFLKEAGEELLDTLNYLEWAMLKGEISLCRWFTIDRSIRFTIYHLNDGNGRGKS
jgi:hypothetical protein